MNIFKIKLIRIVLFLSLSEQGFTQESQAEHTSSLPEICPVQSLEDFKEIVASIATPVTAEYSAGCSDNGHILVAIQPEKITIYVNDADGSELFGNVKISRKDKTLADWDPEKLFADLAKELEKHFKTLHKPIPEHITITNYLEQFKSQRATDPKFRELELSNITPAFVSRWVDPEHAYTPKIVFAVRMKMIIVLLENNDSKRTKFMLDEIEPKMMQKHLLDLYKFGQIPNIMNILSSCSQMLPHMMFFKQETEQTTPYDTVENLSQGLLDSQSALMSWKIEYLTASKQSYESTELFNKILQSKKDDVTVIEAAKQDVATFMNGLSKNQDSKDVFNRIINAIVEELIISHTILPEADKSDEEAA